MVNDCEITIEQSLIAANTGRNGGGIHISGNKGFGNNHKIDVKLINSTVANNLAISPTSGAGGGGLWSKSAFWTGDNTTGNVSLQLIHTTFANNVHASADKNGIQFTSDPAGALTNFSSYNSILISADDVTRKSVNFANSNTTSLLNNIFGGLVNIPDPVKAILDDSLKNNLVGKTAAYAGLATSLSDGGGKAEVLILERGSNAIDFCKAPVEFALPLKDARGIDRDALPDAGAVEYIPVNAPPMVVNEIENVNYAVGFGSASIELSQVFADEDDDLLAYTVTVGNTAIVTAAISEMILTITEVGEGSTLVTVTADDGQGGIVSDAFYVTVGDNNIPTVTNPIPDISLAVGFGTTTIDISSVFDDQDADNLSYQLINDNASVVTASITNQSITLVEVGTGIAILELIANDGNGGEVSDMFRVFVGTNASPVVVEPIADQTFLLGFGTATIDLSNTFSDLDNDPLKLTVSLSDTTIVRGTIDQATLVIEELKSGTVTLTITADDLNGGMVSLDFKVTVKPNGAPAIIAETNKLEHSEGFETVTLNLLDIFSDEEGDELTYSLAVINPEVIAATISGDDLIITEISNGSTDLIIIADDSNGGVATYSLKVIVSSLLGLDLDQQITVYPNPTVETIFIDLSKEFNLNSIELIDMNGGRYVMWPEKTSFGYSLPVHQLASGLYLLRMVIEDQIVVKKVYKK